MNPRFQALVYALLFAVLLGWVLHIGRDILVPVVFSVLVVSVVLGAGRLSARIPLLGTLLPPALRYGLLAALVLASLLGVLLIAFNSVDQLLAKAPEYQATLLALVQRGALFLGIESEPSWSTLRQGALGYFNLPGLARSSLLAVTGLLAGLSVVALYVAFLMLERGHFAAKIDGVTGDPAGRARIHHIIADIGNRIGTYLALKALLGVLLGVATWIVLRVFGVELAGFWALVVGLLNFVPYIGSVLGVALPALFTLLQFGDLRTGLFVAGSLSLVQFLNGNLLDPYLMGSSLNLSPFVILVSLTTWSALWGIPGAFLAVPLTAAMVMLLAEFERSRPLAVLLSKKGGV